MYVYCLFCVTQRCKVIAKLMEIRGAARAFSPQIVRRQRKQGENRDVTFDLLPGYVFIYSAERKTDYTEFYGMDGVIRRVGRRETGYELEGPDLDFAMKLYEKDGLVGSMKTCRIGDEVTLEAKKDDSGSLTSSGGRVLNVIARGDTLRDAIDKAYLAVDKITFDDGFYRKDIGQKALNALREEK